MRSEFLPFSKPTISKECIQDVVRCLESGWVTTGPRVQEFELKLRQYFSRDKSQKDKADSRSLGKAGDALDVQTCSSGTSGLFVALKALDLKPGDEIITTPLTFAATLNVIVQAGCRPVLVDVDPKTYNINMEEAEKAITSRTRVILPVHFAGLSVDTKKLYDLARHHELRVVEDAAHAMGSSDAEGDFIGSFGDIQIFSFHPNKNMTTGEGGCIVSRGSSFSKRVERLRFHGIDRSSWDRFSKKGSQIYDVLEPGYKFNMMDLQAILGIYQLSELESFVKKRQEKAAWYRYHLKNIKFLSMPPEGAGHSYHLFAPCVNSQMISRGDLMEELKKRNIGTGLHYNVCHLFQYYQKNFGWKVGDFPYAEFIGERILSLPLFPTLSEGDQGDVLNALEDIQQGL